MVAAIAALLFWGFGLLTSWEARTWDWRASLLAEPAKVSDNIRLILLDQNSLDWMNQENGLTWPWPREIYSVIVDFCRRNGARALAFDVLYTEPSKWGVDDDQVFSQAVARYGRVAGALFLKKKSGSYTSWPADTPAPEFTVSGLGDWMAAGFGDGVDYPRAVMPVAELRQAFAILCDVQQEPDADGIYRRSRLFHTFDGRVLPTLGMGVYLAAHPEQAAIENGRLTIGDRRIPIDSGGNVTMRYRGPSGTHTAYSAAAVIQSEIQFRDGEKENIHDPEAFRDKYVLFGFSAPGLYDLRSSPVDSVYPGIEVQATILDNFLNNDFIRHCHPAAVILITVVLSLLSAIAVSLATNPFRIGGVGLFFFLLPAAIVTLSYKLGLSVPLVVQETGVSLSIVFSLVVNYATEGRQKRFIKNAFRQYLSPAVIDQLIHQPERLKLGGERRVLSIFFSDLEGFTTISEKLNPEELTNLLNDYLSAMTDIIHDEGGTVDKYEGDAIIAFWNAPLEVARHAVCAVRAALRCQSELARLRPCFRERIGTDMFMRIGLNTGPAVVGNMGSHTRFDYTMLGDAVNLAARLEGVNKQFGTYTMISKATLEETGDAFNVRELGRVTVVGRGEPVTIYEPMFDDEFRRRKSVLEDFARGLDFFYAGAFAEALDCFAAAADIDPPAAAYTAKCRMLMQEPPEHWQGVWPMTSK